MSCLRKLRKGKRRTIREEMKYWSRLLDSHNTRIHQIWQYVPRATVKSKLRELRNGKMP